MRCNVGHSKKQKKYIYGIVQDCSDSIANILALLQFCTKPAISRWLQALKTIAFTTSSDNFVINLIIFVPNVTSDATQWLCFVQVTSSVSDSCDLLIIYPLIVLVQVKWRTLLILYVLNFSEET